VIKKRGLCIFIISFIVTIMIVFIAIAFFKFYTIVVLPLLWLAAFVDKIINYDKIIINSGSITFDGKLKQKTLPFEIFKNADLFIGRGVMVIVPGHIITSYIHPETKDGLIKIVTLSDKIVEKDKLIGKIERWAQLLER